MDDDQIEEIQDLFDDIMNDAEQASFTPRHQEWSVRLDSIVETAQLLRIKIKKATEKNE